jgi:hypothetical protein
MPAPIKHEWTFRNLANDILAETGVAKADAKVIIGHQTTARFVMVAHDAPACIVIQYYDTDIIRLYDDRTLMLDSGGFMTASTKRKMSFALTPFGLNIWQRQTDGEQTWWVGVPGAANNARRFHDGMIVDPAWIKKGGL